MSKFGFIAMKKTVKNNHHNVRIMRIKEVMRVTGYSRSSIYNFMVAGTFPKCKKIGERAVGWNSYEVQNWVNEKLGGRYL